MINIFFAVNTDFDSYLPSQVKNYLEKNNIEFMLTPYNFDARKSHNYVHSEQCSHYNNSDYETWYDFNLIDYVNLMKIIKNYNQNLNLLTDLEINQKKYNDLQYLINYFKNLNEYDLYCFSIYQQYLLDYFICALILFQKNKNSYILFGGPEIILQDPIRELCNRFNISTSVGDAETSVYRSIIEEKKLDYTSYLKLNQLTKDDVPLLFNNFNVNNIYMNTSRGCPNNCYYCSGSKLSHYRCVKSDVILSWIRYYNYQTNVKSIRINDNNFGANNLNYILSELSKFNKLPILMELELIHLTDKVVSNLRSCRHPSVEYGLECVHPEMQKKMNKRMPDMKRILKCFKYIDGKFYYIYGLPGQTKQIFQEELDFLKKLKDTNPKVRIESIPYYLSPKSYIEQNRSKFGIKIISTLEEEANQFVPEHVDLFKKIYNLYDYPERKYINDYKKLIEKEKF